MVVVLQCICRLNYKISSFFLPINIQNPQQCSPNPSCEPLISFQTQPSIPKSPQNPNLSHIFTIPITSFTSNSTFRPSKLDFLLQKPPTQCRIWKKSTRTSMSYSGFLRLAGCNEVKKAHRQLARQYHPDVSPQEMVKENTKRFVLVQEAYETLSDPYRRALYDRDITKGLHLAFSARDRRHGEESMTRNDLRARVEVQLHGLEQRSMENLLEHNMSWAALVRERARKGRVD